MKKQIKTFIISFVAAMTTLIFANDDFLYAEPPGCCKERNSEDDDWVKVRANYRKCKILDQQLDGNNKTLNAPTSFKVKKPSSKTKKETTSSQMDTKTQHKDVSIFKPDGQIWWDRKCR